MADNSRTPPDADELLMTMTARGDRAAYGRLYRKYFPVVTAYIATLDGQSNSPEDLAQEVFVRVWQNRARYQPKAAVKTFLLGYAKNVLRESKARIARELHRDMGNILNPPPHRLQSRTTIENDDRIRFIKKTIARLPDKERQALELVYVGDSSVAKAAEVLKCSAESVHLSLHRARKKLRKLAPSL